MIKNPHKLNKLPISLDYSHFIEDLSDAHSELARYDESLKKLPYPKIIQRTLQTKEAVLSSRIEGTQATLEEVLEFDAEKIKSEDTEKKKDYREIINYREALEYGEKFLRDNPISENFIKKIHNILLSSVRGGNKNPGNFRKNQVYIGPPGAGIEKARYVPPLPKDIPELMSNLINYINSNNEKDVLVKSAIIHAQFEAIHPFVDGNGRVGRILIPLFLYKKQTTSFPDLYISEFFEENRSDYYDLLKNITEKGSWVPWISFFLRAVKSQSSMGMKKVEEVEELYNNLKEKSLDLNSKYASAVIDALFTKPVFSPLGLKELTSIKNNQTIYNLVDKLENMELIRDLTPNSQRNKLYVFKDLMNIIR